MAKSNPLGNLVIGFDGKRAVCNNTGIGNYSRCLISALSEFYPDHKYLLYTPKRKQNPRLEPILQRNNVELRGPESTMFGTLWRSFEMTRAMLSDSVSLVHGLSNELPLNISRSGLTSVVTIHDLIWRRIPQNYSFADRKLYDFKYKASAKAATRIIAISNCTRNDIVNDFGINPEKIDVIYQCCDPIFRRHRDPDIAAAIRIKYSLPDVYILCVGTLEYRKNQMLAVKALEALPGDVKLVLVGRSHKSYGNEISRFIRSHNLSDRVIWLTNVPFDDLPYLYSIARFTSYTSRYEGFGLPIVESLTCGTPVIAATGSCLEEAGGNGAVYVAPDDIDAYIHEASRIIDDSYYHGKLIKAGAQAVKHLDTRSFAQNVFNTYTKAIVDTIMS